MERPTKNKLTLASIARVAGVSATTVSKVLNSYDDVSAETRERVTRVIEEHGYVANHTQRIFRRGLRKVVDLVVPDLSTEYLTEIVRHVQEALEVTEFRLVISAIHDQEERENQWLTQATNGAIDGAILLMPREHFTFHEIFRRQKIPFVIIDDRAPWDASIPSVGVSNWNGGFIATEYLVSLKHWRIAMIGGTPSFMSAKARLAGYRAVLESAHIPIDLELIREGDYLPLSNYQQTLALLDLADPPTAIFTANDLGAAGVYRALYERGLRVPEDVSVIGFDDVPLAQHLTPQLTTIHTPLDQMGRTAITMLLSLIEGKPLDSPRIELVTKLVKRESCAQART